MTLSSLLHIVGEGGVTPLSLVDTFLSPLTNIQDNLQPIDE